MSRTGTGEVPETALLEVGLVPLPQPATLRTVTLTELLPVLTELMKTCRNPMMVTNFVPVPVIGGGALS